SRASDRRGADTAGPAAAGREHGPPRPRRHRGHPRPHRPAAPVVAAGLGPPHRPARLRPARGPGRPDRRALPHLRTTPQRRNRRPGGTRDGGNAQRLEGAEGHDHYPAARTRRARRRHHHPRPRPRARRQAGAVASGRPHAPRGRRGDRVLHRRRGRADTRNRMVRRADHGRGGAGRGCVVSAPLTTPSPYLRDGLLTVVEELRARAEQAAQAQRDADAEVERLRAELADAEDHAKACAAEVDALTTSMQWAQQQAAALSERISPDPARQLAETGLMPKAEQPTTVRPSPAATGRCPARGGALTWAGEHYEELACVATGREECPPPDEDLPFNVVQAPNDVVAALSGGIPAGPDDPSSEPGTLVAT